MPEKYLNDKIIIAEDDPITLLLLKSTLEKWGFNPIGIDNGQKALEFLLADNDKPRIVILDWLMPGLDGIEIVRELRTNQKEIPHYIIMLTSKNEKKDVINALEAGADDFLSKPFDIDELKARIKAGLRLIDLNIQLKKAMKNANKLADFIANYDQTTGLPNRVLFTKKIKQVLQDNTSAILMLINIDRFKLINQAKGLDLGDLLLNYFGARLTECFDEETIVARIAADEFGLLIPNGGYLSNQDDVINLMHAKAQRIHAKMSQRFPIDEGVSITVSIGAVLVAPEIATEPEEFLRRADTALRKAKSQGGNQTVIYDKKMEEEVRLRYEIENELSEGLENDQLQLFLQAQVDRKGQFRGAEALVRWKHPVKGLINPGLFIPIAEETGLILKVGRWVLEQVCFLLNSYQDKNFSISVNISPKQFAQEDFVDEVLSVVNEAKVCADRIVLEVTEGLLINDIDEIANKMLKLSQAGFRFSIDDFGTGYSSLAYIKKLPISEIKIDRDFIKGLPNDDNNAAIVRAIFLMAQALELEVVAEGVETEEQAQFLNQISGDVIHQGYFFSKPAPAESIIKQWIK